MPRVKRDRTAIVEIKASIPKGVSAAQFRAFVKNNLDTTLWPDCYEADVLGEKPVKLRVGKARIERTVA